MSDEQVVEAPVKEEPAKEEPKEKTLADHLSIFPGSPAQPEIESWKQQYGEIFCSGFSESELYVWRPISRAEFVNMQASLAQSAGELNQLEVEEQMTRACILWSSPPAQTALKQKAGSLSTLYEQVMQNSNFMDPRVAAALVIKL